MRVERSFGDVRPVDGEGISIGRQKLSVIAEKKAWYPGQNSRPAKIEINARSVRGQSLRILHMLSPGTDRCIGQVWPGPRP